jgi:hypothetical protein
VFAGNRIAVSDLWFVAIGVIAVVALIYGLRGDK